MAWLACFSLSRVRARARARAQLKFIFIPSVVSSSSQLTVDLASIALMTSIVISQPAIRFVII